MPPKIKFVYSPVYEMLIEELKTNNRKHMKKLVNRIWDKRRIDRYTKYTQKLQKKWDTIGNKAMNLISKTYKLRWAEKDINCYVLDNIDFSFSVPTTLKISKDLDWILALAIHELGHRLEFENLNRINWNAYNIKFRNESETTKQHILLYAVLENVYTKLFGKKKLREYINADKNNADYKRAWEIVKMQGKKNIIKNFVRQLK
jgi:hypothetical protein